VGVLAAAPQAHAAAVPARAATVVEQVHTDAVISRDQPASRHYTVQPGDTLSSIAQRFYGNPADWLSPAPVPASTGSSFVRRTAIVGRRRAAGPSQSRSGGYRLGRQGTRLRSGSASRSSLRELISADGM